MMRNCESLRAALMHVRCTHDSSLCLCSLQDRKCAFFDHRYAVPRSLEMIPIKARTLSITDDELWVAALSTCSSYQTQ